MAASNAQRREAVRQRAEHVARSSQVESTPPSPRLFYIAGLALAAAGLAALVWLYALGLSGRPLVALLSGLDDDFTYMAIPAALFLLAGVPLFFAEMFRRARWSARDRTFLQGGSVAVNMGVTPLPAVAVWMLPTFATWVVQVPVPVLAEAGNGPIADAVRGASDDFWILVSFYGFLSAGIIGVFLASLLKRATYDRFSRAFGPAPTRGRTVWRLLSTQWRAETWLSFASAGLFGVLPLLWHDSIAGSKPFDQSALIGMTASAAVLGVLAILTAVNAWRSGEPYGLAESVA
jgi:hypothetical protein